MVADAGEAARSGGRPVWPGRAVVVVAGVRAALLARGAEPGLVRFDVADSGAPIRWTRVALKSAVAPMAGWHRAACAHSDDSRGGYRGWQ
jgi:hypothetical protein